jgi:hypothetical protein
VVELVETMKKYRKQIFLACLIAYVAMLWGWFLGRGARSEGVEIRRSPHAGWIEVWRHGKLEAEWSAQRDPDLYPVLDRIERNDPSLYLEPAPNGGVRGRGPVLQHQEARRP